MPPDPRFDDPEFVAQFTFPGEFDWLVAVPSNDGVIGAILGLRPKSVLFVNTGGPVPERWAQIKAWFANRPALPAPAFAGDESAAPVQHTALVGVIERALGSAERSRVAFLITGGSSEHTALLTQLALATGATLLHIEAPYKPSGTLDLASKERGLKALHLPSAVAELYLLKRARALVRGGTAAEAVRLLQTHDTAHRLSDLGATTLLWAVGCEARDGLRFPDALEAFRRGGELVARQSRSTEWNAIGERLRSDADAVGPLAVPAPAALEVCAELLAQAARAGELRRFNLAALLYYRSAEVIVAEALHRHGEFPVRDVSRGRDTLLDDDEGRARLQGWYRAALGRDGLAPAAGRPIGLMDGRLLLAALGCEVNHAKAGPELEDIGELLRLTTSRNQSLFAHGFTPVAESEVKGWCSHVADKRTGMSKRMGAIHQRAWTQAQARHTLRYLDDSGTGVV